MKKQIEQIIEFNRAFGVPVGNKPALLDRKRAFLRYKLIREENSEYFGGMMDDDLVNVANELADLLYVVFGAIVEHGLQDKIEEVFDRIHQANMAKIGGGKRADGKIQKPEGWQPADIESVIYESGESNRAEERSNDRSIK